MKKNIFLALVFCCVINNACGFASDSRQEIIDVFHKEIEIHTDLDTGRYINSGKLRSEMQVELESYHEDVFIPKLYQAEGLFCKNKDKVLLDEFFKVLINSTGSADERPDYVLSDMFKCQTDLFLTAFSEMQKSDQAIIYKDLEFGFLQQPWQVKQGKNFSSLLQKLQALKQAIQ